MVVVLSESWLALLPDTWLELSSCWHVGFPCCLVDLKMGVQDRKVIRKVMLRYWFAINRK